MMASSNSLPPPASSTGAIPLSHVSAIAIMEGLKREDAPVLERIPQIQENFDLIAAALRVEQYNKGGAHNEVRVSN